MSYNQVLEQWKRVSGPYHNSTEATNSGDDQQDSDFVKVMPMNNIQAAIYSEYNYKQIHL